jgi:hypothetical protein
LDQDFNKAFNAFPATCKAMSSKFKTPVDNLSPEDQGGGSNSFSGTGPK